MKLGRASGSGVALILLSALLINATIMLVRTPPVYATTCSSSGYYYAGQKNSDTLSAYGVGADASPATWTFNTGSSQSHMAIFVNQYYPYDASWAQTGYLVGYSQYFGSQTSRLIYFEFAILGTIQSGSAVASGYPIPDNDGGLLEAWTYSQNGNGQYVAEGEAYSSYYNTYFVASQTMGTHDDSGPAATSLEAWYSTSGLTCDSFTFYSGTSHQVYTTSVSTSQPLSVGTNWSNCGQDPSTPNSPYNDALNVGTCSGVIEYYGG